MRIWLFLILSVLATGASWLCYYNPLQIGEVSKFILIDKLSVVITIIGAAILFHNQLTFRSIPGYHHCRWNVSYGPIKLGIGHF